MDDQARLREHIIQAAVSSIPRALLEDYAKRVANAYADTFYEIAQSRTTLDEQKLAELRQRRPFRMDWELARAAASANLHFTAKLLPENDWNYTYVTSGAFGLTQAYVPTLGALPQPAKYRDDLANAASIPRLPLDDPKEIYEPRRFYGLLAHNPLGRHFNEEHQKLGSIQLCVPFPAMRGWALEIGVWELLALYPAESKPALTTRQPTWKKDQKEKPGNSGDAA